MKELSATPDVAVAGQDGNYGVGKEGEGLKQVELSPNVLSAMDDKPLVYAVSALVNEKLAEKRAQDAQE